MRPRLGRLGHLITGWHPWSVNRASAAQILAEGTRTAPAPTAPKSSSSTFTGAISMSPGPAASSSPSPAPLSRSPDITAVVGQHVHIVQPIRIINGKLAVFGEGRLISNQATVCCPAAARDGMIVLLTIAVASRGACVSFIRYVPIWVRHPGLRGAPGRGRMAHRSCRRRGPARILRARRRGSRAVRIQRSPPTCYQRPGSPLESSASAPADSPRGGPLAPEDESAT